MVSSLREYPACRRCWRPILEQRGHKLYCPTCGATWSSAFERITGPSLEVYLRSMQDIVRLLDWMYPDPRQVQVLDELLRLERLEELLSLHPESTTEQWLLALHHLEVVCADFRLITKGTHPMNVLDMPRGLPPRSKRSSPDIFGGYGVGTYLRSSSSPFTPLSDDAFQILMMSEVKASLPWYPRRLFVIEKPTECFSFPEWTRRRSPYSIQDWQKALDELLSAGLIEKAPVETNLRLVSMRNIRLKLKEHGIKGGRRKEEAIVAAVQNLPPNVLDELIEPVQGYVLTPIAIQEFRLRAYRLLSVHDVVRSAQLPSPGYLSPRPDPPKTADDLLESQHQRKTRGPSPRERMTFYFLQKARTAPNYTAYLEAGHPPVEGYLASLHAQLHDFETAYREVKQAYMLDIKHNDVSQLANIGHFASLTKGQLEIEIILSHFQDPPCPELESSVSETENTLRMWMSLYDRGSSDGFTSFLLENYEDIFAACGDLSRTSENKYREMIGIPRIGEGWVSEVELLNLVRDILPGEEVVHQASPEWLGLQRLDILVPKRKLAIEYQGRQHYEPVAFFGGEEGFLRTQERDRRKAQLCDENGVTLIYFRYDEPISREIVEARMQKILTREQ